MPYRVYIAGPLYNEGERSVLEKVEHICSCLGFETFLPHRDAGICPPNGNRNDFFFQKDKDELDKCQAVVAVLNGAEVDPGTAWEIGYAYGKRAVLIGYYEDTRISTPQSDINLMIFNSVKICKSLEEISSILKDLIDK